MIHLFVFPKQGKEVMSELVTESFVNRIRNHAHSKLTASLTRLLTCLVRVHIVARDCAMHVRPAGGLEERDAED